MTTPPTSTCRVKMCEVRRDGFVVKPLDQELGDPSFHRSPGRKSLWINHSLSLTLMFFFKKKKGHFLQSAVINDQFFGDLAYRATAYIYTHTLSLTCYLILRASISAGPCTPPHFILTSREVPKRVLSRGVQCLSIRKASPLEVNDLLRTAYKVSSTCPPAWIPVSPGLLFPRVTADAQE